MATLREEDQDDPVITQGDTVVDDQPESTTEDTHDTVVEDAPEGDTRQVDQDHPEHTERQRETARERRQRAKNAKDRDKRELEFQRRELARVDGELRQFRRQQMLTQAQGLDRTIRESQEKAQRYDSISAAAITKQQGQDAVDATRYADQYRREAQQAEFQKNQLLQAAQAEPAQAVPPHVPLARRWMEEHSWYTDDGSEDSRIVKAIDDKIASEGYDPTSQSYWDELSRRVQKRLPQHNEPDDEEEVATTTSSRQRTRSGPPVGGTSSATSSRTAAGGTEYHISAERKQALIMAGYWDDPKMRLKMAKRYADQDRELANSNG